MLSSSQRQEEDQEKKEKETSDKAEPTALMSTANLFNRFGVLPADTSLLHVETPSLLNTSILPGETSFRPTDTMLQSFVFVEPDIVPLYPPATLSESTIIRSKERSEAIKASLGVKESVHKVVEVVRIEAGGCDLVIAPSFPNDLDLNQLPGSAHSCYIITPDKKIYYADKTLKLLTPLTISPQDFDNLYNDKLLLPPVEKIETGKFVCLREYLTPEQLADVTKATGHLHGMGFYKENDEDSPISPLEAVNSTGFQLLGPRHFPTCYAIRNKSHRYVGVFSKLLPGFKPNRDKPLTKEDLEISSLKNMIIKRDEHDLHKLTEIKSTLQDLMPLLTRSVDPSQRYYYQLWQYAVNTEQYYLGDENSAQHVQPKLDAFIKLNGPTITFKQLEDLRQTLINRRLNIEQVKDSYIKTQHKHEEEIPLLNKAIAQLNLILLDEVALYMKQMHRISYELQNSWVNLEAEKTNKQSRFSKIQITDGVIAPLDVSIQDIINFRTHVGQAIGLTQRYFMQDPDGHAKNISADGLNVDGDKAAYPLTYRFTNGRKPGILDFAFNPVDFVNFPNLSVANFRYWPTNGTILETSTDTLVSQVSDDLTKNFFTSQDNINYKNLEKSAVFSFQKYIQLIAFALTDKAMYTACAKLHMTPHLHTLNDEGKVQLPLLDSDNHKQDLRTKWIECMSARAAEARAMALQLPQVKMILERHGDLVLELVLEQFKLFLSDRSKEINEDSMQLLERAIQPNNIVKSFELLKADVSIAKPSQDVLNNPLSLSL